MRRLLVEGIGDETVVLAGEQHHRAVRVLRLGRGDRLQVFDGRGNEYEAVVESADREHATLSIERRVQPTPEPAIRVSLFQSIPRGDAMERVVQKCVEIGVAKIVPLVTRRTVVRPRRGGEGKLARWRKIALHAVEQSGRAWLVPVAEPVPPDAIIDRLSSADLALVPHTTGVCHPEPFGSAQDKRSEGSCLPSDVAAEPIRSVLDALTRPQSVAVVIGPEGGFSPDEVERFAAAGARPVSLGPRTLRSETAGLVAASIVLYHYGEMG